MENMENNMKALCSVERQQKVVRCKEEAMSVLNGDVLMKGMRYKVKTLIDLDGM